jgi:hypothetical protein
MVVVISRFLFGWIALTAKAGVRAAVKDRNHCRRNAGQPAIDRSDDPQARFLLRSNFR